MEEKEEGGGMPVFTHTTNKRWSPRRQRHRRRCRSLPALKNKKEAVEAALAVQSSEAWR